MGRKRLLAVRGVGRLNFSDIVVYGSRGKGCRVSGTGLSDCRRFVARWGTLPAA